MSKGHLSNDDFFLRLPELFDEKRQRDHGSIFLTQKRMTHSDESDKPVEAVLSMPFPDLCLSQPARVIIRATNGRSKAKRDKKIKLSTVVDSDSLEAFFTRYAEVCKSGMSGLKKRDRSRRKKETKAKKKKGGVNGQEEVKKA